MGISPIPFAIHQIRRLVLPTASPKLQKAQACPPAAQRKMSPTLALGGSGHRNNAAPFRRRDSRACMSLYAAIAIVLGFALFVLSPLPDSTWQNVMSKLRLWELTEYERICFLDGDTILTDTMDGIFEDAAAAMQESGQDQEATEADEAA